VIELENTAYSYPPAHGVLDGISLNVRSGEYLVVCGPNGSGKSTFGYLLNGLIPHFLGGVLTGIVRVAGFDTRDRKRTLPGTAVGLVFQNADAQLFNLTVADEIAFGLEHLGLSREEIQRRMDRTVDELEIRHLLCRAPETLSGGEKRIVAVASVLCLDPSVLVLDEPFANLDAVAFRRLRLVLNQVHETGITLVVIEHLTTDLLKDADRCVIIENGRISFDGPAGRATAALADRRLIPRYPKRSSDRVRSASCVPVVSVKKLRCSIQSIPVLKDVTFDLKAGEPAAIVGRNGAGKTTLIKHLNGLLRPDSGTVRVEGIPVRRRSARELAAAIGVCFQNPNDQFFRATVRDELLTGPRMLGRQWDDWIEELCDMFDLYPLLDRSPYRLSEGEKKRVAVASILAMKPRTLVLDEPAAGQDARFREALVKALGRVERTGCALLVVTHEMEFARAVADRRIVLEQGTVISDRPFGP